MKLINAIFNIIKDLFRYSELKNMGFTMKDIVYYEFNPVDKAKKVQSILNK